MSSILEGMVLILSWHYSYLSLLVISLLGLGLIDWRWRLVIFDAPRAAGVSLALLVAFFVCWDIAGIGLHIFSTNQAYVSGINLGSPNLPLEEILFLTLLNYVVLICYRGLNRSERIRA